MKTGQTETKLKNALRGNKDNEKRINPNEGYEILLKDQNFLHHKISFSYCVFVYTHTD